MATESLTEYESIHGMSPACTRGLRNILMACADTKLLMGYHYGEWTFGTPELEAAVASCSLSQSELGHVRLLHALLKKHYDEDPDRLVEQREASAFANIAYLDRPIDSWTGFVAMNAIVDLAVTRLLHSLVGSAFRPLRMSVDKMLEEERYHLHHGRGWFRALAGRGADVRGKLEGHAQAALAAVDAWYGPPDEPDDAALVAAAIKTTPNRALFAAFREDVRQMAAEAQVELGPDATADFGAWDPATRRARSGGPDAEILFHLRGSKNEMFKLS